MNTKNGARKSGTMPAEFHLHGELLEIANLTVTGAAVRVVREAAESGQSSENTVRQMLEIGGAVLEQGKTGSTIDAVSTEIDRLLEGVAEAAAEDLPRTLEDQLGKFGEILAERFDPGRVGSVQRQIVEMVDGASAGQRRTLVDSLLDKNGPLGGLKSELVGQLAVMVARQDELIRQITTVGERFTAAQALDAERERGTAKGVEYESLVVAAVDWALAPYGDTVVEVGTETGAEGNKAGDILGHIDPDSAQGRDLRIVIEAKCRKLGVKAALQELDRALENREAHAGLLVFAETDQAPLKGRSLRVYPGNRIVCVFERGGADRLALEVACQLARSLALVHATRIESEIDPSALNDELRKLVGIIDEAKTIKRGATAARKGIDVVDAGYEQLRSDALESANTLASKLVDSSSS